MEDSLQTLQQEIQSIKEHQSDNNNKGPLTNVEALQADDDDRVDNGENLLLDRLEWKTLIHDDVLDKLEVDGQALNNMVMFKMRELESELDKTNNAIASLKSVIMDQRTVAEVKPRDRIERAAVALFRHEIAGA